MSIKYKDSNGTTYDVAGGLTADMAQTMIDDAVNNLVKTVTFTDKSITIPTGGYVSWYNLTGVLNSTPKLATIRLTNVVINGTASDCFATVQSSRYGIHVVFTNINDGLPLANGTVLVVSGVASYIGE